MTDWLWPGNAVGRPFSKLLQITDFRAVTRRDRYCGNLVSDDMVSPHRCRQFDDSTHAKFMWATLVVIWFYLRREREI